MPVIGDDIKQVAEDDDRQYRDQQNFFQVEHVMVPYVVDSRCLPVCGICPKPARFAAPA
jgi:hypothetical protein